MNIMNAASEPIIDTKAKKIGTVIDHLVDALGGEPACTLRRAVILADINEFPGTTQSDIMQRLGVHKSALNRDIEWLYDYGCVMRQPSSQDGREIKLFICGYAKKNMDFALDHFESSHKNLKNFLIRFISLFGQYKPTLRDAKIVSALGDGKNATKQEIFETLYSGPTTTDNRAVNNLIELGFIERDMIEKSDEQRSVQTE